MNQRVVNYSSVRGERKTHRYSHDDFILLIHGVLHRLNGWRHFPRWKRSRFKNHEIDVDTDSTVSISVRNFPILFIFPRTSYDIAFVIVRVASIGQFIDSLTRRNS